MSITHLSLVNQKFTFAHANLADMEMLDTKLSGNQKTRQQALGDAVVFHLTTALSFYVRELADQYRVQNATTLNTIDELYITLGNLGINSSEVNELMALKKEPGAWLYLLLSYERTIFKSPERIKEKKAFVPSNVIEVIDVTEVNLQQALVLRRELLTQWLVDFKDLVMRHRSTYAEY